MAGSFTFLSRQAPFLVCQSCGSDLGPPTAATCVRCGYPVKLAEVPSETEDASDSFGLVSRPTTHPDVAIGYPYIRVAHFSFCNFAKAIYHDRSGLYKPQFVLSALYGGDAPEALRKAGIKPLDFGLILQWNQSSSRGCQRRRFTSATQTAINWNFCRCWRMDRDRISGLCLGVRGSLRDLAVPITGFQMAI